MTEPTRTGTGGLACSSLEAAYGRLVVCDQIDLDVPPGEVSCLIGPNGAGKTSLVKALAGLIRSRGSITVDGEPLGDRPAHVRARRGIATVPDDRGLFPTLSGDENLRLGAKLTPKAERAEAIEAAVEAFPRLKDLRHKPAGSLSGGEQQMLAIAKALAGRPRVLLLDEPSQGLAPVVLDSLRESFQRLRDRGLPILLVEQNHRFVTNVASRFCVMARGRIVLRGGPAELADREAIAEAYLSSDPSEGV